MSCKKDHCPRRPPDKYVNRRKWSDRWGESTPEKPIHARTRDQRKPKVLQDRNKCWAVSIPPQPNTQKWDAGVMMPRVTKFVFVGNLSRKSLQAKIITFKGIYLCEIRSSATSKVTGCWEVNSWYALRTE
jgi:hypothetical protein